MKLPPVILSVVLGFAQFQGSAGPTRVTLESHVIADSARIQHRAAIGAIVFRSKARDHLRVQTWAVSPGILGNLRLLAYSHQRHDKQTKGRCLKYREKKDKATVDPWRER